MLVTAPETANRLKSFIEAHSVVIDGKRYLPVEDTDRVVSLMVDDLYQPAEEYYAVNHGDGRTCV